MPSPNWDKIYQNGREYPPVNEIWLNRVLGYIETADKFPETALDIRCGTGGFAVKLAQRNIHTTGLDLSAVALDKAKKRAEDSEVADKVEFIKANIEDIDQKELPSQVDLAFSKLTYAFITRKYPDRKVGDTVSVCIACLEMQVKQLCCLTSF
jgi:2-polyprenyl-3-methyl-5-hydroxy-6-metoxy-1,4-benzoquinol methylase